MSDNQDIRWRRRYSNFRRSVANLQEALETENPSKLERQGIIKAFELCYELAWKTLQDYLGHIGYQDTIGPKPVISRAFEIGLLHDGDVWANMHRGRNESAHVYSENKAIDLERDIRHHFAQVLVDLADELHRQDQ